LQVFDTYLDGKNRNTLVGDAMAEYLNSIPDRTVVLIGVHESGTNCVGACLDALNNVLGTDIDKVKLGGRPNTEV